MLLAVDTCAQDAYTRTFKIQLDQAGTGAKIKDICR